MSNIKFTREIEYSWHIRSSAIEALLKDIHTRAVLTQTYDIEQVWLTYHEMHSNFDFEGKHYDKPFKVRVNVRIRKESEVGARKTKYTHTTKYELLDNDDNNVFANRLELNAPILKEEYEWLKTTKASNAVVNKKRILIWDMNVPGVQSINEGRMYSIDLYPHETYARVELEVDKGQLKGNPDELCPKWLKPYVVSQEEVDNETL